jgi:5-formyltetrahydrofolate cyclo-ligase
VSTAVAIDDLAQRKQTVRERVWTLLQQTGAAAAGVHGHIPAFAGADAAADRLATVAAWGHAQVVKANPDRAQLPVRVAALQSGKLLYMAVPRLATPEPFYRLDPTVLTAPYDQLATGRHAARLAPTVSVGAMNPIDVIVCGSVAVNRDGARLGKGAGYSDIEVALLTDAGLIQPHTTIVTTVHPLQVLHDQLPEAEHDFRVDLIITPEEMIECRPPKRHHRIRYEHLTDEQIAAMPALRTYRDEPQRREDSTT